VSQAFTIGSQSSYDRALAESDPVTKLGVRPEDDPPYEGGWVWRTAEDALAFIQHNALPFKAAVYVLELPTGWNTDVSPEPHPSDGVHRLLHDALITGRVGHDRQPPVRTTP